MFALKNKECISYDVEESCVSEIIEEECVKEELDVSVGRVTVEWRTPAPTQKAVSPKITIGSMTCHLNLFKDSCPKYVLKLDVLDKPSSLLQVTTCLSQGGSLTLPKTTTIEGAGCCEIWRSSKADLSIIVPTTSPSSGFHFGAAVTKAVEVGLFFKITIHEMRDSKLRPGEEARCLNPIPSNSGCLQSLSYDLRQLLNDSSDHDVKLRCEGEVLSAHRSILSTRSKVFKVMLQADMLESKTGLVEIQNMVLPALQHFLAYLYTGTLPDMTVELAMQVYEAGDKYAVDALKKWCAELLRTRLEDDNVCKILLLADVHNDEDLKKSALSYVLQKEIPKKWSGWADFCASYHKLAMETLNYYVLNK